MLIKSNQFNDSERLKNRDLIRKINEEINIKIK